jgi:glucokinase
MNYVLGIDIGGTNVVAGIVNKEGDIIQQFQYKTNNYITAENLITDIYKDCKLFERDSNLKVSAVGIGAPNANYFTGEIEFAPNLNWGNSVPISKIATKYFNLPVKIINDANAAAIGEKFFGCAKEISNFVLLTIGTGLGSGIYVNGKILLGKNGMAGEFGHTQLPHIKRVCSCGQIGCIETIASKRGILQTYKEKYNELFNDFPDNMPSIEQIYQLALNGNNIALSVFQEVCEVLSIGIANLIMILDTEAIILFGGIANAHKIMIPIIENEVNKRLLPVFKNKVKILPSMLLNKNASVLGSAAMFFCEF